MCDTTESRPELSRAGENTNADIARSRAEEIRNGSPLKQSLLDRQTTADILELMADQLESTNPKGTNTNPGPQQVGPDA